MAFILILLIILFLGGAGAFFLKSYDEKYVALQRNNLLLKSQIVKLQEKCNLLNSDSSTQKCSVEFLTIDNHHGLLPQNTEIRISPLNNSSVLKKINTDMKVDISEKVIVSGSIWYYVTLPIESSFNSRGWVEESHFLEISDYPVDVSEN